MKKVTFALLAICFPVATFASVFSASTNGPTRYLLTTPSSQQLGVHADSTYDTIGDLSLGYNTQSTLINPAATGTYHLSFTGHQSDHFDLSLTLFSSSTDSLDLQYFQRPTATDTLAVTLSSTTISLDPQYLAPTLLRPVYLNGLTALAWNPTDTSATYYTIYYRPDTYARFQTLATTTGTTFQTSLPWASQPDLDTPASNKYFFAVSASYPDGSQTVMSRAVVNNDQDNDRLSDTRELYSTNTDPTDPDTDGDGLDDFVEINVFGTDPNNPDSDGDGYSDGEEVGAQVLPNDPDQIPTASSSCQPDNTTHWLIQANCLIDQSFDYAGSITVDGGAVLTIGSSSTLGLDFVTQRLLIKQGAGVRVLQGAGID